MNNQTKYLTKIFYYFRKNIKVLSIRDPYKLPGRGIEFDFTHKTKSRYLFFRSPFSNSLKLTTFCTKKEFIRFFEKYNE